MVHVNYLRVCLYIRLHMHNTQANNLHVSCCLGMLKCIQACIYEKKIRTNGYTTRIHISYCNTTRKRKNVIILRKTSEVLNKLRISRYMFIIFFFELIALKSIQSIFFQIFFVRILGSLFQTEWSSSFLRIRILN